MSAIKRAVALSLALVGAVALPGTARGHEIRGFISPEGVAFFAEQLASLVPAHIEPPALTKTLFHCVGGKPVNATHRNTSVDLEVHSLDLLVPRPGTMRLDMYFSASASGEIFLDNPYACFGEATCSDYAAVNWAHVVVDFDVITVAGKPRVLLGEVDLEVTPDEVDFELSDCAVDDIVNWVVDFGKEWLVDLLVAKIEELAEVEAAPVLEEMVVELTSFEGAAGSSRFSVELTDLQVEQTGLSAGVELDIFAFGPAAECIASDPGEPQSDPGTSPDLAASTTSHLGLSVALSLANDALYHVWRSGLTCLTDAHLRALGLDLALNEQVTLLPGFPQGTEAHLDIYFEEPPRVVAHASAGAELTLVVDGVNVDLTGVRPDGTTTGIHLEADASATARLTVDPAINSLVLEILDVSIDRLIIEDQVGASDLGFDVARLHEIVEERFLPEVLRDIGRKPIVGSVFGYAGYFLILRDLRTSDTHLTVGADMFRAPANDASAPDTFVTEVPSGTVPLAASSIHVMGIDVEVPSELLRYQVAVNGVVRPLTHMRELVVGVPGESGTYRVEVAAVDLSGNVDSTPAATELTVDGVEPHVAILHGRRRLVDGSTLSIEWVADDDLTENVDLLTKVSVHRLTDRRNWLASELAERLDVPAGVTSAVVALEPGNSYRIEVSVRDLAGNESTAGFAYRLEGEGSGCAVAGTADAKGLPALLFLALVLLALRAAARRSRRVRYDSLS